MNSTLIINAQIVNEGKIFKGDVLIEGNFITEVGSSRPEGLLNVNIIDAKGEIFIAWYNR